MLLSSSQMVTPGFRSIISPGISTVSPRSPLDMKFSSSRSLKRYDNGGIGLGIVAALENSSIRNNRYEISSKQNPVYYTGFCSNRLDPVRCAREIDLSEEYTCVTSRDGLKKVYYNENEFEFCQNRSDVNRRRQKKSMNTASESPEEVFRDSPDFLNSCSLCKKKLQGKAIYMYKGDKGFCSEVCRSVRIMEDNLNVQRKPTRTEILSSAYAGRQISSTGIFVI